MMVKNPGFHGAHLVGEQLYHQAKLGVFLGLVFPSVNGSDRAFDLDADREFLRH